VWLGLGNALFAGGALALILVILQQSVSNEIDRARADSEFQTRISLSADLRGFDPVGGVRTEWTGHGCVLRRGTATDAQHLNSLEGWSFNAKNLEGARLDGMGLRDTSFRDARLVGATFICADLAGANLQRANLDGALLSGANLAKADMRGARLGGAIWDVSNWEHATVDVSTCWPKQGPWGANPAGQWMKDNQLRATSWGAWPPSYGHFCNDRSQGEVIYDSGIRVEKNVPPAMGRTDVYEEGRWRDEMLRGLKALGAQQKSP
jgi:hypothetical protein